MQAEHRAELERLRTDTARRLGDLRAAHRAQLEALTAADHTRSDPTRPPATGQPAASAVAISVLRAP